MRRALSVVSGIGAALLLAHAAWQLRVASPCLGDPTPIALPELAARVWDLPVVVPTKTAESADTTWVVSYPTRGSTTYALGVFTAREDWQQVGNDAHTLGPRSVKLRIAPRGERFEGPWMSPIFDFPDHLEIMKHLELRCDDATSACVLVGPFQPRLANRHESPWSRHALELPPHPDHVLDEGITFRVLHHPAGHRALRRPEMLLLAAALAGLALWLARGKRSAVRTPGASG